MSLFWQFTVKEHAVQHTTQKHTVASTQSSGFKLKIQTHMIAPTYPFSLLFHNISQESLMLDTIWKRLPYLVPCPHQQCMLDNHVTGRHRVPCRNDYCTDALTFAAKGRHTFLNARSSDPRVSCVNRPIMPSWFKGIFLMKLAWYFSRRRLKFFDASVSGRWEFLLNRHGTFSVFKKRQKSFHQSFQWSTTFWLPIYIIPCHFFHLIHLNSWR